MPTLTALHTVYTLDEVVALSKILTPDKDITVDQVDDYQWVTPLIQCVRIDGVDYPLKTKIVNGVEKHGAAYPRVSTLMQQLFGFSADEQVRSLTNYFVDRGLAFRIYSDVGLSGSLPYNDPNLIARMVETKVRRTDTLFRRVFLNPSRQAKYTPDQERSVRAYLAGKIAEIRKDIPAETLDMKPYRKQKLSYRPGLTTMMEHLPVIHHVAATDMTRLSRNQHLLAEVARGFHQWGVIVVGVMEGMDYLNATEDDDLSFGNEITAFVLGKVAELKLRDAVLGNYRGLLERLEQGIPYHLPEWMERDKETKKGRPKPGAREAILKMLDVFEYEFAGTDGCANRMKKSGLKCPSKLGIWTGDFVRGVLTSPNLVGKAVEFGLTFEGLCDPLITEERWHRLLRLHAEHPRPDWVQERGRRPPEERATHLATSLIRCICQGGDNEKRGGSMMYQGDKTPGFAGLVCCCRKQRPDQQHVRLSYRNVCEFVNELMAVDPVVLMGGARGKATLQGLHDALRRATQAVQEARVRLDERRTHIKPEVEAIVRAMGIEVSSKHWDILVAAHTDARMDVDNDGDMMERLEAQVHQAERAIAEFVPQKHLASIEDRVHRWHTLEVDERNDLLLQVFEGWYLRCVDDQVENLEMVMVLRGGSELPPVRIQVRSRGNGFERRLPPAADWVRGVILAQRSRRIG